MIKVGTRILSSLGVLFDFFHFILLVIHVYYTLQNYQSVMDWKLFSGWRDTEMKYMERISWTLPSAKKLNHLDYTARTKRETYCKLTVWPQALETTIDHCCFPGATFLPHPLCAVVTSHQTEDWHRADLIWQSLCLSSVCWLYGWLGKQAVYSLERWGYARGGEKPKHKNASLKKPSSQSARSMPILRSWCYLSISWDAILYWALSHIENKDG